MPAVRRMVRAPLTIEQRSAASGPGAVARQKGVGDEPVLEAPIQDSSPETGGYGLLGRSIPVVARDRLGRAVSVRAVEAACRVAVARGDASGVQLVADPADRSMSERGKRPGGARQAFGLGQAHRPLLPSGRGGGLVVVVGVTPH